MKNLQGSEVYDHMEDTSKAGYKRLQDEMNALCLIIALTALALGIAITFLT